MPFSIPGTSPRYHVVLRVCILLRLSIYVCVCMFVCVKVVSFYGPTKSIGEKRLCQSKRHNNNNNDINLVGIFKLLVGLQTFSSAWWPIVLAFDFPIYRGFCHCLGLEVPFNLTYNQCQVSVLEAITASCEVTKAGVTWEGQACPLIPAGLVSIKRIPRAADPGWQRGVLC